MSMVATTEQEQAFDTEPYTLPIPKLDGHTADKVIIALSGSVELDRHNPTHLEFIETLTLGKDVDLDITATVTRKGFTLQAGKEDSPESTGYGVGLKVHSLEVV